MFSKPCAAQNMMMRTFLEWSSHLACDCSGKICLKLRVTNKCQKWPNRWEFDGAFLVFRKLGNFDIDWASIRRDHVEFKRWNQFLKIHLNDFCLGTRIWAIIWAAFNWERRCRTANHHTCISKTLCYIRIGITGIRMYTRLTKRKKTYTIY